MRSIKNISKLFLLLALFFSQKGFAQSIASTDISALRAEYASIAGTVVDEQSFAIFPASVKKNASLLVNADKDGWASFQVRAACGKILLEQQMAITKGMNKIPVFFVSQLEKGNYSTVLKVEEKAYFSQLVKE